MSGTKQYVEQRLQKRRIQESKDLDLRRKLAETNILAGHGKSEVRVEGMRRARSEAAERRDLFMDYQYTQQEQDKTRRTHIAQFEEHLADGLARRKATQLRDEMDKRRICDGSEELRTLKENLHMAKVNKERAQQLLEIQARNQQDRFNEQLIDEQMENERLMHCELEHKLVIEKAKQREKVKHINQQQLAAKEAQRAEAMQEYLQEKQQVKELVDKIAAEDQEEFNAREEKKKETKQLIKMFMEDQKARAEAMDREEREENERIEAYARNKREREQKLQEEKDEAEREKKRVLGLMIGVMEKEDREKRELEMLRNELHFEELEKASRRRDELRIRKRLEDREEMKNAYIEQMRMKEEKNSAQKAEDDKLKDLLLQKFAEDDRIELLNEQKRRMKVQEHKREAERLIKEKREMYERARQEEIVGEAKLREEEAHRHVIIEEERQRLIKEHAAELRDFLPKGTLESAKDLDLFEQYYREKQQLTA